tara:strand:+ start:749550 stop:750377 length:828 start_codon:yes stop_codon:yes gene_type:complete
MIFVGVAIVVGVLILAATCAHFVQRRSVLVADARRRAKQRQQKVSVQDELVIESLIDSVSNGQPLVEALPEFLKARAALLPEKGNGGNWAADDLSSVLSNELRESTESISRSLFLPMFLSSLLIVALTVVGATTLYTFFEQSAPVGPTGPLSAPTSKLYDPFPAQPFVLLSTHLLTLASPTSHRLPSIPSVIDFISSSVPYPRTLAITLHSDRPQCPTTLNLQKTIARLRRPLRVVANDAARGLSSCGSAATWHRTTGIRSPESSRKCEMHSVKT